MSHMSNEKPIIELLSLDVSPRDSPLPTRRGPVVPPENFQAVKKFVTVPFLPK